MACQSMLIVLVGTTPAYHIKQQDAASPSQQQPAPEVIFTEDVDSIVTEVSELGCLWDSCLETAVRLICKAIKASHK